MFFFGGGRGGGCCCCWSACGTAKHVAVASHCVQKRQNGGRITRSRLKALRVPSSWLLRGGGRSFQIWTRKMGTISLTTYELQIRKSQDPAKDVGERQVKPRRKFVNQKLWAIYSNITKLLYRKWKLNEKKKEKKKKRKEKKWRQKGTTRTVLYYSNWTELYYSNSGPLARGATALPLGHVEHTCTHSSSWNFYYQNLRALLDMNSKIFFRRTRRL